jgi:hypothetical protein
MAKAKPENRTETGKFKKGFSGNPGGRPKKPAELELYAKDAPAKLRAIADDPATPVKIRADIEKFFFEAVYGKAPQAIDLEGKMENTGTQTIQFEGVLDEWSR